MKVLLVYPRVHQLQAPVAFPVGLGILAALLRQQGHEVVVYDQQALNTTPDELLRDLRQQRGIDLVGLGGLVTTYRTMKSLVPALRALFPGVPVVLGGGVTVDPALIFERVRPDICVHGEAEETLPELVAQLEAGSPALDEVRGISFVRDGELHTTEPRPLLRDLDCLPLPAYDLFPAEVYFSSYSWADFARKFRNLPSLPQRRASLLSSRGCPNQCTFCWRMAGRNVRHRSLDRVVEEIELLRSSYGVDSYVFLDECVNASPRRARALARALVDRGLQAPWYGHARVDRFDEALARELQRSGCVGLNFGVESGSPRILAEMKKNATPEQAGAAVRAARRAGIVAVASLIIGMPGETKETVRDTLHWLLEYQPQATGFSYAVPYPGCELYSLPLVQARIRDRYGDKDAFFSALAESGTDRSTLNMTSLSDRELFRLRRWAMLRSSVTSPYKWRALLTTIWDGNERRRMLSYLLSPSQRASAVDVSAHNRRAHGRRDVVSHAARARGLKPAEQLIFDRLRSDLPRMTVLDVGCGAGRTTRELLDLCQRYVGIDSSAEMVAACQRRFKRGRFVTCDARALSPFDDGVFDLVLFSFNGIDYNSHVDRLQILGEVRRVLRAEGTFVFSSHNLHTSKRATPRLERHLRPLDFTRRGARYIVSQANRLRLRRREVQAKGHAIFNDQYFRFRFLTYYISKQAQAAQLAEAGFALSEMIGESGRPLRPGDDDAEDLWIYYVARAADA